jgi:hypothetical protein
LYIVVVFQYISTVGPCFPLRLSFGEDVRTSTLLSARKKLEQVFVAGVLREGGLQQVFWAEIAAMTMEV